MKTLIVIGALLFSTGSLAEHNHPHHAIPNSDGTKHDDIAGVPELDKSTTASAAVLLSGGLLIILGSRKKKYGG